MFFLYALVGLAAGVGVNYVADRALQLMQDKERARLLRDRRLCASCGQATWDRIEFALWRFVARRGRCTCGARLPLRPVLVELAGALIFAYLWAHDVAPAWRYAGTANYLRLALHSAWMSVFLLVTVTDLEHRLILNAVMYPAIALALAAALFTPDLSWRAVLIGGVVGFVFFYLAALAGNAFFGSGALGFGDVTLAAFIGLITGFPIVVLALVLGILAGGVITLLLLVTRIRSLRSAVPYGPFLVVGGVAALLWGPQIVQWYFGR